MDADRLHWNRKYREGRLACAPAPVVRAFAFQVGPGRALDLACGNGRNACFLAALGFRVEAIDYAAVGLQRFVCRHAAVQRLCLDLDFYDIPPQRYDLIINLRYLNRRLFPQLREGLKPGGLLIFESYLKGPEGTAGGKFRSEHLLARGELLHVFADLQIVYYREYASLSAEAPSLSAALVARRHAKSD